MLKNNLELALYHPPDNASNVRPYALTIFYWNLQDYKRLTCVTDSDLRSLIEFVHTELESSGLKVPDRPDLCKPDIIILGEFFISPNDVEKISQAYSSRAAENPFYAEYRTKIISRQKKNMPNEHFLIFRRTAPSHEKSIMFPNCKEEFLFENSDKYFGAQMSIQIEHFKFNIKCIHVSNNDANKIRSKKNYEQILKHLGNDPNDPTLLLGDFNFHTSDLTGFDPDLSLLIDGDKICGTNKKKDKIYDNGIYRRNHWNSFKPVLAKLGGNSACVHCRREFSDHTWLYVGIRRPSDLWPTVKRKSHFLDEDHKEKKIRF